MTIEAHNQPPQAKDLLDASPWAGRYVLNAMEIRFMKKFINIFYCAAIFVFSHAYAVAENSINHTEYNECDDGYEQWSETITTTCSFVPGFVECTRFVDNNHYWGQACTLEWGTYYRTLPTGFAVLSDIWWYTTEFVTINGTKFCASSDVGEMCWNWAATWSEAPLLLSNPEDSDSDNVANIADAFPSDSSEWLDTDADGTGNNADWDDDNDGIPDSVDPAPLLDDGAPFPLDTNYKGTKYSDKASHAN